MIAAIIVILVAGAIGGIVNGIITDRKVIVPGPVTIKDDLTVWSPGILGNMLVGAVAAFLYWSIYGSGNNLDLMNPPASLSLPLLTVGFSVLTGIGGARWLTNEVDKYVLRKSAAMVMNADSETTKQVMEVSAMEVLKLAASHESK